MSKLRKHQ